MYGNEYEYRLDLYPKNFKAKKLNDDEENNQPLYRAEGEIMLDLGNYQDSKNMIWSLASDMKLILCGKIDDASGVELVKDGKAVKRIAGTQVAPSKLVIDLKNENSGEYEFRVVKGFQVLEDLAWSNL